MLMSLLFIIDLSAQPQSSFNKPSSALPSPQHTAKQMEGGEMADEDNLYIEFGGHKKR